MVSNGISALAHKLLDVLDAAHLGVDLLEDAGALLEAEDDVLLDEGELDVAGQLLELGQLQVRLLKQGFLVLLPPQGEQGALLVARRQHLPRDGRLLVREHRDPSLILVQLVALQLEVEDRSIRAEGKGEGGVLVNSVFGVLFQKRNLRYDNTVF